MCILFAASWCWSSTCRRGQPKRMHHLLRHDFGRSSGVTPTQIDVDLTARPMLRGGCIAAIIVSLLTNMHPPLPLTAVPTSFRLSFYESYARRSFNPPHGNAEGIHCVVSEGRVLTASSNGLGVLQPNSNLHMMTTLWMQRQGATSGSSQFTTAVHQAFSVFHQRVTIFFTVISLVNQNSMAGIYCGLVNNGLNVSSALCAHMQQCCWSLSVLESQETRCDQASTIRSIRRLALQVDHQ
mmetsp:Transcript_22649/g.51792  ORF Transcript_22649/g.51792 Transcript_22649/m.51792 type:complete len:239 (+) Transcript_22649:629-1345(+)